MKRSFLIIVLLLQASFELLAQCPSPSITTCPQTNWSTPYLTTVPTSGLPSAGVPVSSLSPNTDYFLVLEALPTEAPCAAIIIVLTGDGFVNSETGLEFDGLVGGKDVPAGYGWSGKFYKVPIKIKTKSGVDFVPQLYFRYRMECSVMPGTGTVGGGNRVPSAQKQALIP